MGFFHPTRTSREAEMPPPRRSLLKRLPWELRLLALAAIYLGVPAIAAVIAALAYYTTTLPDPMAMRQRERAPLVRVLARDGKPLNERGSADAYVPIDLLPQHLIDA